MHSMPRVVLARQSHIYTTPGCTGRVNDEIPPEVGQRKGRQEANAREGLLPSVVSILSATPAWSGTPVPHYVPSWPIAASYTIAC